jgi:hypothetical protein
MDSRNSHVGHDRVFFWLRLLLVLSIIIMFGYLFCGARACY